MPSQASLRSCDDSTGLSGFTTRRIVVGDVLTLDRGTLSAAQGGQVAIRLATGPMTAGLGYFVCGTLSGTSPGTPLAPGLVLPLNVDGLTLALIQLVNTPLLARGAGALDLGGQATATFAVPPGLLGWLNGRTIHWAAAGVDTTWRFVSNARGLQIVP